MTNADGNAGETSPSGSQPSEPLSGGYEAPSIEQSQHRPQSYEFNQPFPPAIDYPSNIPHDYPPPPGFPPPYGDPGYPPPSFPPYPPQVPGYPPPPGYGAPGYPVGYGFAPPNPTNSLAIGSLVASVLSLPMVAMCAIGLIAAIVGIGLGITALNQIKRSGQAGRGLAIAGIAVGAVGVILNGAWILIFLVAVSTQ